jgi:antitoxin (DNA-binding transcriptional repressor) of toxin-antitoxin stability system
MRTMTVRDIRLKWPEAERDLRAEGEIIVTRDSKPVARLLPFVPNRVSKRTRFDPDAHMRWLRRFWAGKRKPPSTDELLARDRADS